MPISLVMYPDLSCTHQEEGAVSFTLNRQLSTCLCHHGNIEIPQRCGSLERQASFSLTCVVVRLLKIELQMHTLHDGVEKTRT